MNFKNSGFSSVKILDVLNDGEYHKFKIIKKCEYTEKQRKLMKYFKEEYNYYYRLSFVDKTGNEKITDTTFYQPITKTISEELENYKKANGIISNSILYIIKIACVKTKYNNYFVEVVDKYKFEKKDNKDNKPLDFDNYNKHFNKFKESLKYVKFINLTEKEKQEIINHYTPENLEITEQKIKFIDKVIKSYKEQDFYDLDISMFSFGFDNIIYKSCEDMIKAMQDYEIEKDCYNKKYKITNQNIFDCKFCPMSPNNNQQFYDFFNEFYCKRISYINENELTSNYYKNKPLSILCKNYSLCFISLDSLILNFKDTIIKFCLEQAYNNRNKSD